MGADNTKLMLETFQTHLNLEIESRFWGLLTTFPSVILVNQFRADFGAPPKEAISAPQTRGILRSGTNHLPI